MVEENASKIPKQIPSGEREQVIPTNRASEIPTKAPTN